MKIRAFHEADAEAIKEITAICFDGVCIDQNIEERFGLIAGRDWRYRKLRHIDADIAANPDGIFVAEVDGRVAGYVTVRLDAAIKVGNLANLAVRPDYQQHGIGRKLIETAIDYARREGMACLRIETLEQNAVGTRFYPRMGFEEIARQVHYALPLAAEAAKSGI